jgi:hypothetical protein
MNKRLLGGLAAAGIIGGGVYGFAATLDLTTDNLAANSAGVSSCDADGVDTDYTVAWDSTDKLYEVATVIVRGIDANCAGDSIAVTLADTDDASLGEETNDTVTAGNMTFTFTDDDVSAKDVENIHVAIAGGDS